MAEIFRDMGFSIIEVFDSVTLFDPVTEPNGFFAVALHGLDGIDPFEVYRNPTASSRSSGLVEELGFGEHFGMAKPLETIKTVNNLLFETSSLTHNIPLECARIRFKRGDKAHPMVGTKFTLRKNSQRNPRHPGFSDNNVLVTHEISSDIERFMRLVRDHRD
jgi:hypothetical protein